MTGLDILWIAIAFAVVLLAGFWCAVLWRVASLLWRVHGLVDEGREALADVRRSLLGLTNRLDGHLQAVTLLGDRLIRFVRDGWEKREKKTVVAKKNTRIKEEQEQG